MVKKKQKDLLQTAIDNFKAAKDFHSEQYRLGEEDVSFAFGQQWPEDVRAARESENQPCLIENRLLSFVHQVINDIRQANLSIKVSPVDDKGDVETANILRGMIRNIQIQSDSETVYDTAAFNSITSGFGFMMVKTKYADDDTFDQEICLERILNPFSVFFDPASTSIDGSDAEFACVYDDMNKDDFEAKYPNVDMDSFEKDVDGWCDDNTVRVVDYYYKDYTKENIYRDEFGEIYTQDEADALELDTDGMESREVERCKVKMCRITRNEILEQTELLTKYIPIIPVYGEEVWLNGKRQVFSLIHQAKDPQRRLNYWLSASTAIIALQPRAPYIGAVGQFNSRARQWQTANTRNPAYLEYDPVDYNGQMMPPPQRQAPPTGSASMMQEMMVASEGIKASIGIFDASLGAQGNEQSGRAIMARQREGDNATFHFIDNLSKSIKHVGRILVDMIPQVYDGARMARIIGEDEKEILVPVNQPLQQEIDGVEMPEKGYFDLKTGKYDVVVSVGQSYATKRQETVDSILQIAQAVPEVFKIGADVFLRNLDVQDADILAKRAQAIMPPEVLKAEGAENVALEQASQMIEQLQQQLQGMAQELENKQKEQAQDYDIELQKLEIDRQKLAIDAAKAEADIKKMQAETTGESAEAITDLATAVTMLKDRIDDIDGAFNELLSDMEDDEATGEPQSNLLQPE